MYYEERIIEGKWHWRGTPDGSWVLFSEEQLHRKCCVLNQEVRQLRKELPKELVETEEDCGIRPQPPFGRRGYNHGLIP